jgi:hypothetical protein
VAARNPYAVTWAFSTGKSGTLKRETRNVELDPTRASWSAVDYPLVQAAANVGSRRSDSRFTTL